MPEKLTVEELIKAMRCCTVEMNCTGCPLNDTENCGGVIEIARKAADALESLVSECNGYRDKLKAALAENTRLAEQISRAQQLNELEESPEMITRAMRDIKDTHCGDYDCLLPENKLDDSGYWADDAACKDCTYGACYRALECSLHTVALKDKPLACDGCAYKKDYGKCAACDYCIRHEGYKDRYYARPPEAGEKG